MNDMYYREQLLANEAVVYIFFFFFLFYLNSDLNMLEKTNAKK